jgi:hypothetical protein
MFVGKAGSLPRSYQMPHVGWLATNTPAYSASSWVTKEKKFYDVGARRGEKFDYSGDGGRVGDGENIGNSIKTASREKAEDEG